MSHWLYIALAYGAFLFLLLWDFLMPQWTLKNTIRTIRIQQRKSRST